MADSKDSIKSLLRDVSTYLRFLKDIGLEYAVQTASAGEIQAVPSAAASPGDAVRQTAAPSPAKPGAPVPRSTPAAPSIPRAASTLADSPLSLAETPLPPPLPVEKRRRRLEEMYGQIAQCAACRLSESRTNTVPGVGSPMADLMFIGEGPGADEDRLGEPFVGKAGKKLDEMIAYLGLTRREVYICNIVKCRPPGNRNPAPDEAAACRHFLDSQIEIIQPKVICLLGRIPLMYMTGDMNAPITRMRGRWLSHRGIPMLPTFHPAYLLRSYTVANRKAAASDMDAIRDKLKELGCKVGEKKNRRQ